MPSPPSTVRHAPVNATGETPSAPYDRLIMATGANAFLLPLPGSQLPRVLGYRDIADTQAMIGAGACSASKPPTA